MTSRLGVYWSVMHRRPQDYDFFRRLQPSVFKIMDGGPPDYEAARNNLPNSLIIARDHPLSEQHADMMRDPTGTGKRHAQEWNQHQPRLGFDRAKTLVLGINEPHVWEPGIPEALRLYTIAMCDEATTLGLRVGAMQFSVGWPGNTGPDTPPNWEPFRDVDNAIRRNNGALICHEYWADNGPGEMWGWWGGRVLKCPWQVPIIIGETGVDMFVKDGSIERHKRGWRGNLEPERYARELADYTARMSADSRFVGNCVFAADFASQDWFSFDIEPAYQAILATPIPDTKPIDTHLPSIGNGAIAYISAPAGLKLRAAPSTSSAELARAPYGTQIRIVGVSDVKNWVKVRYGDKEGYMYSQYISTQEPKPLPTPEPTLPPPPTPVATNILDPLVAQAILQVESGGRTHGENGKVLIRLEAHVFRDRAQDKARVDQFFRFDLVKPWTGQEWRINIDHPWRLIHTGSQQDEYNAFAAAQTVDAQAAYESISVGAGQLMGFNHARVGYPSAEAMFRSFQSAPMQIVGFLNFFLSDPALMDAVHRKDWREIARRFNGSGAVDTYAPLLEKAYKELAQ